MRLEQVAAKQILTFPQPTTTRGHTKTPLSTASGARTDGEFALDPIPSEFSIKRSPEILTPCHKTTCAASPPRWIRWTTTRPKIWIVLNFARRPN